MLAYRGLRLQLILRLYATWPAMHHMGVQTTNPKPRARPHHRSLANKELLSLGAATATFLEALPQRVVWIVSADLAHTRLASGPYGFCPCAQPFDNAVLRWAKDVPSQSAAEALLQEARRWQREGAASCGFTGLVAAQGAMAQLSANGTAVPWAGEVLAYGHPTYYGMMVAKFEREPAGALMV
ncbi:unnamed protein product [Symbiodinium natans]|uniref:Uncharacterized protein n=1 Tax=Symbiodinium natans TaxID=878477 RepID=A0A812K5I2_9DINO|nr:unnamed protein product [Symbiodinium natans]